MQLHSVLCCHINSHTHKQTNARVFLPLRDGWNVLSLLDVCDMTQSKNGQFCFSLHQTLSGDPAAVTHAARGCRAAVCQVLHTGSAHSHLQIRNNVHPGFLSVTQLMQNHLSQINNPTFQTIRYRNVGALNADPSLSGFSLTPVCLVFWHSLWHELKIAAANRGCGHKVTWPKQVWL